MRSLVLRGPREASVVEAAEPSVAAGEVLLKIGACGVCGSDLNAWRGVAGIEYPLPPGAPGHETWGIVFEVETAQGLVRWENVDGSFFHFRTLRNDEVLLDRAYGWQA